MASERIRINDQGRVVIPVAMRKALGIKGGDTLTARYDEERAVIEISTPAAKLKWIQEELRRRHGDDLSRWSDELIAERRAEARREQARLDAFEQGGA